MSCFDGSAYNAEWQALHTQVPCSKGFLVDEGLVELLEELWLAGIDTQYSCQGGPEWQQIDRRLGTRAQIVFPTVVDGVSFLQETMRLLDWEDAWAELFELRIVNPIPGGPDPNNPETRFWYDGAQPRTEVIWDHKLTKVITAGWRETRHQRKDW